MSNNRDPHELLQRGFQVPGADALAVRQTGGAVRHALQSASHQRAVVVAAGGNLGDDEPAAPTSIADHTTTTRSMVSGVTEHFDAARLFLRAPDGGAAFEADIEVYRVTDLGDIVRAGTLTGVPALTEVRDAGIGHRRSLYRLTNITLDGASGITLCVAGEGAPL